MAKKEKAKKYLTITEKLDVTFSPSDFDTSVINILAKMNELVEQYGETVYLDFDYDHNDYTGSSGTFEVKRRRPETVEEYLCRRAKEKAAKVAEKKLAAEDEKARRELYEALKIEFEGGG